MVSARVAVLALAALLLSGVGVGVALTRAGDEEGVVAASVDEAATSTSTTVLPTTSTVTSAPTTAPVAPATTIRRTTTTAVRPTTTTAARTACTPTQVEAKLTTSRPAYAAGELMEFTTTLHNKTGAPCTHGGWAVWAMFKDDAGHTFPGVGVSVTTLPNESLTPGEVLTHSGDWDHRACPEPACGPLPPGPASVVVRWHFESHVYELTQSFILT